MNAHGAHRPVRVVIVDDQVLMRQGLRKLLEIEAEVEVVGDAADGAAALALVERLGTAEAAAPPPEDGAGGPGTGTGADVALVDLRMPGMGGIELIERLQAAYPGLPALVLTTFDDDADIFGGLRAGAKGYLLKDTPPEELVAAILRAARGETVLGTAAAARLVAHVAAQDTAAPPAPEAAGLGPGAPSGLDALSERERDVALLVAEGAANRQIARRLFITEGTVKNHISSILRKLALRDRTQIAVHVARLRGG